ncbi:hypothetical protein SAMN02745866_02397 [Alteromonadaceae bacterium Bs31]|nr:hypothetical protein SAMN02745866_02397 [Alteromonadaceae bacterium Bs31]
MGLRARDVNRLLNKSQVDLLSGQSLCSLLERPFGLLGRSLRSLVERGFAASGEKMNKNEGRFVLFGEQSLRSLLERPLAFWGVRFALCWSAALPLLE